MNTVASIWGEKVLRYLSLESIYSSKLTVLLKLHSRKTVHFLEQVTSVDNYPGLFLCQLEAIVYILA